MNERSIALDGAFNFRDLGGYRVSDGRRVKWGRLFRSDDLMDLSRADLDHLASMDLRTVIDFRDPGEARSYPDRVPSTVTARRSIPIEAGRLMRGLADGGMTRQKAEGIMISVYRALVNDFQHSFREFFEIVQDRTAAPLLYHCTAGKDRTGMASAFLLSALGVDRPTVMDDYLLSRDCLRNKYQLGSDYDAIMEPLYSVQPEFLQAALDVVDRQYGGMERYLADKLEVDSALLREMYTEPDTV